MSAESDPALYASNYERQPNDRYWTEPWVTNLLLQKLGGRLLDMDGYIWDPAAGRGDMSSILLDYGLDVVASDIDLSEFDSASCPCFESDFRTAIDMIDIAMPGINSDDLKAVICNPPFGKLADIFLRQMLETKSLEVVALLLRSEFNSAGKRSELFDEKAKFKFAYEIVITKRPRWDWWFREEPEASPRHNFSWFVWDKKWEGPSTQFWMGK